MKKITGLVFVLCLFWGGVCSALDNPLVSMRTRFIQESNNIKLMLKNSRDVVLLTSLWDSCFIAASQLDAYFSLIGIFETIKPEDRTEAAINYLLNWLNDIKQTNASNIRSLNSVQAALDKTTNVIVRRMKINIYDLDKIIDTEINRLTVLKESIIRKNAR
jgi:hypothetical protein